MFLHTFQVRSPITFGYDMISSGCLKVKVVEDIQHRCIVDVVNLGKETCHESGLYVAMGLRMMKAEESDIN